MLKRENSETIYHSNGRQVDLFEIAPGHKLISKTTQLPIWAYTKANLSDRTLRESSSPITGAINNDPELSVSSRIEQYIEQNGVEHLPFNPYSQLSVTLAHQIYPDDSNTGFIIERVQPYIEGDSIDRISEIDVSFLINFTHQVAQILDFFRYDIKINHSDLEMKHIKYNPEEGAFSIIDFDDAEFIDEIDIFRYPEWDDYLKFCQIFMLLAEKIALRAPSQQITAAEDIIIKRHREYKELIENSGLQFALDPNSPEHQKFRFTALAGELNSALTTS